MELQLERVLARNSMKSRASALWRNISSGHSPKIHQHLGPWVPPVLSMGKRTLIPELGTQLPSWL